MTTLETIMFIRDSLGSASSIISKENKPPYFTISSDYAKTLGYKPTDSKSILHAFVNKTFC